MLERHNRRFEIGHTPGQSNGLVDWMRQKGFANDELVDAGLAHRRSGDSYVSDFYRHRVLIPVRDRKRDWPVSSAATSERPAGPNTPTRPAPSDTTNRSTSTSPSRPPNNRRAG